MTLPVLITGSEGLIGTALRQAFRHRGTECRQLDLAAIDDGAAGNVLNSQLVSKRIAGCGGIVHLAAVSRVMHGEMNPELCWRTNVAGTETVLKAAIAARPSPWVIFASSREVYGEPREFPVREDSPLEPINVYARSKAHCENLVNRAREHGLRAAIVRLSNVYGSITDYPDRVTPAFCRAAVEGGTLHVEGGTHTFDFTHLSDTVRGIVSLADLTSSELPPSALHLVTGVPTKLAQLAHIAVSQCDSSARIVSKPPRNYDVRRFWGDPNRAKKVLGWTAQITLEEGIRDLVAQFRNARALAPNTPAMRDARAHV